MHTFTTTIKYQSAQGVEVLNFESEAKDRLTAQERALEKLFAQHEDEIYVVYSSTRSSNSQRFDKRDYANTAKPKRH